MPLDIGLGQTLTAIEVDAGVPKTDIASPAPGNRYVAVLVELHADQGALYSPYYGTLQDADGFEYEGPLMVFKEPHLSGGELRPGGKVRGWITFEVPTALRIYTLRWHGLSEDTAGDILLGRF